jgi:hypothetical protein
MFDSKGWIGTGRGDGRYTGPNYQQSCILNANSLVSALLEIIRVQTKIGALPTLAS